MASFTYFVFLRILYLCFWIIGSFLCFDLNTRIPNRRKREKNIHLVFVLKTVCMMLLFFFFFFCCWDFLLFSPCWFCFGGPLFGGFFQEKHLILKMRFENQPISSNFVFSLLLVFHRTHLVLSVGWFLLWSNQCFWANFDFQNNV